LKQAKQKTDEDMNMKTT